MRKNLEQLEAGVQNSGLFDSEAYTLTCCDILYYNEFAYSFDDLCHELLSF